MYLTGEMKKGKKDRQEMVHIMIIGCLDVYTTTVVAGGSSIRLNLFPDVGPTRQRYPIHVATRAAVNVAINRRRRI